MSRKQQLLKEYRQRKRFILMGLAACLVVFLIISLCYPKFLWVTAIFIACVWLAHEAWMADHLFYSPKEDYKYDFPEDAQIIPCTIQGSRLCLNSALLSQEMDTLFLAIKLKNTGGGYLLDPQVIIKTADLTDRQDFERGVNGLRYINLSGLVEAIQQEQLTITTKHCQLEGEPVLYAFTNPDYTKQRMMIIAPHADDAELAAFGVYSQSSAVSIITLTQGEIEAEHYQKILDLNKTQAAQLKARLRSWDSIAVPLWGGVPQANVVQLGYYCMQLKAMHQNPEQAFGSKESGESDTRLVRTFNSIALPSDEDGKPTWNNLKKDLASLIEHFKPEVIILPYYQLDPHDDHTEATRLVDEILEESLWQPTTQLLYANHLHDNDMWPMGPANNGIALPPAIEKVLPPYSLYSPTLTKEQQVNKAMALAMQHDLQPPLPCKKRMRRIIQKLLAKREWPQTGENPFFRKAVRRHEIFWVKK